MIELQEEIFSDDFIKKIGVIRGRIATEMAERSPGVSVGQGSEEGVTTSVIEGHFVEIDILRLGFVNVVRDGAEGILPAGPAAAAEGGSAVHAGD